ncbi:DUF1768 domain-containing protein [Clostridium botulinum]|nr:DUF1768 domain-containing protein [Clostridium botulinum]
MSNYDMNKLMAPLWIKYPNIPNGSIGWRMGYGESYSEKFYRWFSKLSEEKKNQYNELFEKPKMWEISTSFKNIKFWTKNGKPEYSRKQLIEDFSKRNKIKYTFFWGHQPSKNGEISTSCFSQWYESDFNIGHIKYFCMEQYMMSYKAKLFNDKEIEEKIMNSKNPKEIKALGRKIKNFDEDTWNKYKYSIILNGNYTKFTQNEELRKFLLNTKDRILVEASPYDNIWGIGMSKDNPNVEDPTAWKGENLLGFALTEVRSEISRVYKNYDKINL